jgi:hypothetical protein
MVRADMYERVGLGQSTRTTRLRFAIRTPSLETDKRYIDVRGQKNASNLKLQLAEPARDNSTTSRGPVHNSIAFALLSGLCV